MGVISTLYMCREAESSLKAREERSKSVSRAFFVYMQSFLANNIRLVTKWPQNALISMVILYCQLISPLRTLNRRFFMYDIERLDRDLKLNEHETAQALYHRLLVAGYASDKAVSLVYHAGYIDGRGSMKLQKNVAYRKLEVAEKALTANGVMIPNYNGAKPNKSITNEGDTNNE